MASLDQEVMGIFSHSSVSVPVKDKKLLEVKLGELPSWILMRDFSPSGIFGAFQRGYYRYYNKYINVKKGSISGITMVLACYVLFSYSFSYKHLKHERLRKYH
uniref:ATP synthase F(0) complex subunit f, mitochondrial n=2 Tax=Pan TaxID=9596 RepID=A0A2I3RLZ7_PANTR